MTLKNTTFNVMKNLRFITLRNIFIGYSRPSMLILGTVAVWLLGILGGFVSYLMTSNAIFPDFFLYSANWSSILVATAILVTLLSLIEAESFSKSQWDAFKRVLIYNMIWLALFNYAARTIYDDLTSNAVVQYDKVVKVEFFRSSNKSCSKGVHMYGKNLQATYCADGNLDYDDLKEMNQINATIAKNTVTGAIDIEIVDTER